MGMCPPYCREILPDIAFKKERKKVNTSFTTHNKGQLEGFKSYS